MSAIDQLCPSCGLCCNGVLFGDVELQPGDDAKRLAELGVELLRRGRKRLYNQPCACLEGGLCRIYNDRPVRCRSFNCRTLMRFQQGEISVASALGSIAAAKGEAAEVLRLVRALGNSEEHLPLNRRYAALMAQPVDLAGDEAQVELRGDLMLAVGRLVEALEKDFLV